MSILLPKVHAAGSFEFMKSAQDVASVVIHAVSKFIHEKIDLHRIVIISSLALSCLAIVASIYTASFLALSLSFAFASASCLSYKINAELISKRVECHKLFQTVTDHATHEKQRLADHKRMEESIGRLELESEKQKLTNEQLTAKLSGAMELVGYCESVLGKASILSECVQNSATEQKAGLQDIKATATEQKVGLQDIKATATEQKAGLKDIKTIAAELASHKTVLTSWMSTMQEMLDSQEPAKAAEKVIDILNDFKEGQHTELAHMLTRLQEVQKEFTKTQKIIEQQQSTLESLSQHITDKTSELTDKTSELVALHIDLSRLHKKNIQPNQGIEA